MKTLDYYMALRYRIEIAPIPEEKGGGYEASIPELGRYAVCADGETIQEALVNLEAIKRDVLEDHLEEGLPIPEPMPKEEDYSGKFVLRIPKSLHRELSQRAREDNVSLNQYTTAVLSAGLALKTSRVRGKLDQLEGRVNRLFREEST